MLAYFTATISYMVSHSNLVINKKTKIKASIDTISQDPNAFIDIFQKDIKNIKGHISIT